MLQIPNPYDNYDHGDPITYTCPICGAEVAQEDDAYLNQFGAIIGCKNCVSIKQAYEVYEEDSDD